MKIIIYDKELKELIQKHVKGRMGINITLADISFSKTDNFGIDTEIFIRKPGTTTFPAELSGENERYEKDLSSIQLRKMKNGEGLQLEDSKQASFRLSLDSVELEQALVMLENVNSDEDPIRVLDRASFDPEVSSPNDLDILFNLDTKAKDININFYGRTSKGDQWLDGTLADMILDRFIVGSSNRYPSDDKNAIHQE